MSDFTSDPGRTFTPITREAVERYVERGRGEATAAEIAQIEAALSQPHPVRR